MRPRWVIVVTSSLVLLQGCSSGHHTTAKPHPGVVVAGSVADRYLQLANGANEAIGRATTRLREDHPSLSGTEDELRSIAQAKRSFDHGLESLSVSPEVKPAVADLLSADAELERRLDAGAHATTIEDLSRASPGILEAGAAAVSAAATVRRLLGLAPLA